MALVKKLIAVTNILHDGEETIAGEPVDTTKFTKPQLTALYEGGAIRIEEVVVPDSESTVVTTPKTPVESKAETSSTPG